MNYKESSKILTEIKKAKRILLNCHRDPDADSAGSALALCKVLEGMGKRVSIFCPSEIPEFLRFIKGIEKVKASDFRKINYSDYDLFISLDTAGVHLLTTSNVKLIFPEKINVVVIDHHKTNDRHGHINLVDETRSSTCEILYLLFKDWGLKIDQDTASFLLTGIIGDTGGFIYSSASSTTFKLASELIDLGVDKNKIIRELFFSIDINTLKFWGHVFQNMKVDKEQGLVWSKVSYNHIKKLGGTKAIPADKGARFFQRVKGADIGILFVEREKDIVDVSFRSKEGSDVSKIADSLGGGGHENAAGAFLELPLDKAVEKVLALVKKYVKKNHP